jgi:hypothetical protein
VVVDFAADSLAMEVQHVISLIEHHELKTPTLQLALMGGLHISSSSFFFYFKGANQCCPVIKKNS